MPKRLGAIMKSTEKNTNQITNMVNDVTQLDANSIAQIAASLIKDDDHLSDAVKHRLADSRQSAVNRLLALQSQTQLASPNGVFSFVSDYFVHHRAISAAFAMMLVTFFALQQFGLNNNIENSDAYLLASDLPPEAFADKGFNTWIASAHN